MVGSIAGSEDLENELRPDISGLITSEHFSPNPPSTLHGTMHGLVDRTQGGAGSSGAMLNSNPETNNLIGEIGSETDYSPLRN